MKTTLLCCATFVAATATQAFAQNGGTLLPVPTGTNIQNQITHNSGIDPANNAAAVQASLAGAAFPMTPYSVRAYDGRTYTGTLVGTSPFDGSGLSSTIDTPIVPVIVSLNLPFVGPYSSDPTGPDQCLGGMADVDLITNSPIFNATDYTMNGEYIGNTQYVDAFQRASFWQNVAGTEYHVLLNPIVMSGLTWTPSQGYYWGDQDGVPVPFCGDTGYQLFFDINEFDPWVKNVALPAIGADPTQFPILLFQNVSLYDRTIQNCCILGYHTALASFQTYSPSNVDTSGFFTNSSDTATLSHEVAEWMDDPLVNNATPAWGHIGQVAGCQANLETGDPLSGTLFPDVFMNGFDYHLQELAFFSWFFGGDSLGAGGVYSDNGTFAAPAGPPVCR